MALFYATPSGAHLERTFGDATSAAGSEHDGTVDQEHYPTRTDQFHFELSQGTSFYGSTLARVLSKVSFLFGAVVRHSRADARVDVKA